MRYRSPYGAISSIFKSISNSIRHGDGDDNNDDEDNNDDGGGGDNNDDEYNDDNDDDGGGGEVADDKSWRVGHNGRMVIMAGV